MRTLYFDTNATTPVDPRVRDAILPYLCEEFGNASSGHRYGQAAHRALEVARRQVAECIQARADEIVFTGGGSEASNQAIKGTMLRFAPPAHLILSAVEHPATTAPADYLQSLGYAVTRVPVDRFGRVDPDEVRRAIRPETRLISVMHSNNEVGTLQPIAEIASIARGHAVLMHTDAAQSVGKVGVDFASLGVDLMTIAGHKLYAPKGIGVLVVRRGVEVLPLIHGASHERALRAGTENIPYIAGLGRACELVQILAHETAGQLQRLRDRLHERLLAGLGERIVLNGHPVERLPNTLNLGFLGWVGSELLASLPELAASTGAACHDGKVTESPVLKAMNAPTAAVHGAVRLSVGRFTTEDEVDQAAELIVRRVKR